MVNPSATNKDGSVGGSCNSPTEFKYIPLRKLMTALYLLSKDSKYSKVDSIFSMYEHLQ
jgi:hypothetical protein